MSFVIISLSELQKFISVTEESILANEKDFLKLAYNLGADTSKHYEVQHLTHRNKFNEVVDCPRYVFSERTDDRWLKSGNASFDVQLAVADPEIRKDVSKMKRGVAEGNTTDEE